jgi:hypothetical protein
MGNDLGPIQKFILSKIKEYYSSNKGQLVTTDAIVVYTGLKYTTVKKAMELLARKQRLRRISPKRGYGLLC